MLTQLSTLKTRLALTVTTCDDILTSAIKAISVRFDKETNRTLARAADLTHEFAANDTEVALRCYPVEAVTKFEVKANETEGWVEQTNTEYLLRRACVVSITQPLGTFREQARVTFTGGYVLPGTTPDVGQTPLPDDLEQAAVEQVASWFQNRDKLGLIRNRPNAGTYQQFAQLDLLPNVSAVLKRYERWMS
jgi:hypothetical protein